MPKHKKTKNLDQGTDETTGEESEYSGGARPDDIAGASRVTQANGPGLSEVKPCKTKFDLFDNEPDHTDLHVESDIDERTRPVPSRSMGSVAQFEHDFELTIANQSRSELNLECIPDAVEKEIHVQYLNPVYFKQGVQSYKTSTSRIYTPKKILDDTNWKDDNMEDAVHRLDQMTKPVVVNSIISEIIETAVASTDDAMVDSIINDVLERTFRNTSDSIANDIVNEIIDSLPEEEIEMYSAEYKPSGRINQIFIKDSTVQSRSFLPYIPLTSKANFIKLFKQLFLPYGFPDSVSADYAEYQVWDSLQAFFSTLTGALTTHSVMKGVGVGDANATAASAAITWMLRDGTGMVGRIIFASWKGTEFDMDCKKWRFFADILNDSAMFLECILPVVTPSRPMFLLCLSTVMKSLVGVAGGATRAAITQHQAIRGNMADVSAKDSSQESCVNLIASLLGILILMTVADSRFKWDIFTIFVFAHLMCNYRAVKAIRMATLNTARFVLILRCYFALRSVGSIKAINRHESVILGRGLGASDLCGYNINLGVSLSRIQIHRAKLESLCRFYKNYNYILYVDNAEESVQVFLKETATSIDIIKAFYHATLLGIGTCVKDNVYLLIVSRQVRNILHTPVDYMISILMDPRVRGDRTNLVMRAAGAVVKHDFPSFLIKLQEKGWDTTSLQFNVEDWRSVVND